MIISKYNFKLAIGVFAYIGVFQWIYISWLYPNCGYFGFTYVRPPNEFWLVSWLLSLVPLVWLPKVIVRPSQFIYWTLYLTVIIPSMFVPLFMGLEPPSEILALLITLIVGFWLLGINYRLSLFNFSILPEKNPTVFWLTISFLYLALNVWTIAFFGSHLRLVQFSEIYDLRDAAGELAKGTLIEYPVMWLSAIFNPFLMACGLNTRKRWMFWLGGSDQILLYATDGAKIRLLSILIILAIHFYSENKSKIRVLSMVWLTVLFPLALMTAHSLLTGIGEPEWLNVICGFVFMRTMGISGFTTGIYYDFFQTHPYTYFSHIHGINLFIDYPFQNQLGVEVGKYSLGRFAFDANAHLWATDGIGGLGLTGIIIVSIVCAFVFLVLDTLLVKKKLSFTISALSFSAMQFSNMSIFTCLLSGGLIFLILILCLVPGFSREPDLSNPS